MTKKKNLSDKYLQALKADTERSEIRDTEVRGLEIRVSTQGTKSWAFRYRRRSDGKKRGVTLGRYPEMSLKEAREEAYRLRASVMGGEDPALDRDRSKSVLTFAELAEKRLAEDQNIAESTKYAYRQCFNADVYTDFGDIPVSKITRDIVARCLDKIEKRGSRVQADRTKAAIGSTFKWALARVIPGISADPTFGLGKRASATPRLRVPSTAELSTFWNALHQEGGPISEQMKLIFQIALLTGKRRTEVAGMKRPELDLSGPCPKWTIPGHSKRNGDVVRGRSKNRKPQIVPLTKSALDRINQAIALSDESLYLFPAFEAHVKKGRTPRTPHINPQSVTRAASRLTAELGIEDFVPHDFRRTVSTWMGDNSIPPHICEAILGHQPKSVTAKHYNHSTYEGEMRRALERWDAYLVSLLGSPVNGLSQSPSRNIENPHIST